MADAKKASQKALSKAYPRDEAGMAQLFHAQLYFKYIPLYIKVQGMLCHWCEDIVSAMLIHTRGVVDAGANAVLVASLGLTMSISGLKLM